MNSRSTTNNSYVQRNNAKLTDSLVQISLDSSSLTNDIGWVGQSLTGAYNQWCGAFFDRSDGNAFKVFAGYTGMTGVDNSNVLANVDGNLATIKAGSISSSSLTQNLIPYVGPSSTLHDMTGVSWDNSTQFLGVGTANPTGAKIVSLSTSNPQIKLDNATNFATLKTGNNDLTLDQSVGTGYIFLNSSDQKFSFGKSGSNFGFELLNTAALTGAVFMDYIIDGNADYNTRLIRNAQTGGNFDIIQLGTGNTRFYNNNVQGLLINYTGFIGINQSSPDTRLHVTSSGDQLKLEFDGSNQTTFGVNSNGTLNINTSSGKYGFGDVTKSTMDLNLYSTNAINQNIYFADDAASSGYVRYNHPLDYMEFGTNQTSKMMIQSNGRIMVCDSASSVSPGARLHSEDKTTAQLRLSYTGALYTNFTTDSSGYVSITPSGGRTTFLASSSSTRHASDTSTLAIVSNVLPTYWSILSISAGSTGSSVVWMGDTDDPDVGSILYNHQYDYMAFGVKANYKMMINPTGYVMIGNTATNEIPDARLHIVDVNDQLKLEYNASNYTTFQTNTVGLNILNNNETVNVGDTASEHIEIQYAYPSFKLKNSSTECGSIARALNPGEWLTGSLADDVIFRSSNNLLLGTINSNSVKVSTNDTIAAIIDTNQQFGIGTTGPNRKLEVRDNANPQLRLSYTGGAYTDFKTDSSGNLLISPTGGTAVLQNTATTASNVGMSFISGTSGYIQLFLGDTDSSTQGCVRYANSDDALSLQTAGTSWFNISSSGNCAFNNGSSPINNARVEILDGSKAQLRLTNNGSNHTSFETDNTGNLNIAPSSGTIVVYDGSAEGNLICSDVAGRQVGIKVDNTAYSRIGTFSLSTLFLQTNATNAIVVSTSQKTAIGPNVSASNEATLHISDATGPQLKLDNTSQSATFSVGVTGVYCSTGFCFPNDGDVATMSPLNWYQEDTSSYTWSGSATGVSDITCIRIGKQVTLTIEPFNSVSAGGSISLAGTIPTNFRPSNLQKFVTYVTDNSANTRGFLNVYNNGLLTFGVGDSSSFTASGNAGLSQDVSVNYAIT